MARLGDVCEKVTDYVASGSFAALKENVLITNEENYAIMVKTADFANGFTKGLTYTDKHGYDFLRNSNLFGGELILSNIGSIGKVFKVPYLDRPMTLASNTVMIKTATPELTDYLYYYFLSPAGYKNLLSISSGTSMLKFNKTELKKLDVPVPNIDMQRRIISVMDKVSELIALRKEQLAKLDELVKARFVEMFGDAVSNEKGWPLATLAEIAEIKIGPFGSLLHKEDYKTGGHALVNPSHIIGGKIVTDENLTIDDAKYAELSAYHLYPGDIVMGRRGEMGRCAVVYQNGLLCGTGSLIIRPNERMKPYFLQSILSSPTYKKVIEDKAVGVTMMNLNVPIVSELTVPLLPVDLQERFVEFMAKIDETKLTIQSSLDKLVVMQKALMQEYFG